MVRDVTEEAVTGAARDVGEPADRLIRKSQVLVHNKKVYDTKRRPRRGDNSSSAATRGHI